MKNWYRTKSLNQVEEEEELVATIELSIEIPEWTTNYECFIESSGHSTSRLDYVWSSTNESILTISEYSSVTIKKDGTCSIICKNEKTGAVGILDIEIKNNEIVNATSRYVE